MKRKAVITECMGRTLTALLEDEKVIELHYSPRTEDFSCRVGEIYVGKVKKILPNIHGAFIEIKKGLECYYSLEAKNPPVFTSKIGKKPLCIGDELLVQVEKEAVKTKKPTVTGNLNFTGKYTVVTSGNQKIGVSSKLSKEKRAELLTLGEQFADSDFGIIFRTNAGTAPTEVILEELNKLINDYQQIIEYGKTRTCFSCLRTMPDPAISFLRDLYQDSLEEIVADKTVREGRLYQDTYDFLKEEQPEDLKLLRAYEDESYPLAKCYSLEHATEEAIREKVWMKSGAYLVIQPTEALTVIDVNSGKCLKKKKDFMDMNEEAAREAARQIRLRNLSGIILIDFINMDTEEERRSLLKYLQRELSKDPNPGKVVDMTSLQLVEITRKKVRKTLEESLHG